MRSTSAAGMRVAMTSAVVAAVLLAGFAGIESWPLTSWRLFAGTRSGIVYGWEARAVTAAGAEETIVFHRLGPDHRNGAHLAADLEHRPPSEASAICREWGQAWARHTGDAVDAVRVYRTNRRVVRPGDPRPRPVRLLRYSCELP